MHQLALPFRPLARSVPKLASVIRPCTSSFSTTASKKAIARPAVCRSSVLSKRSPAPRIRSNLSQSAKRHNSSASAVTANSTSAPRPANAVEPLTWNRFLALRKTRRRISLVASILGAGASAAIGITILSKSDFDVMQFGIDPTFVIGGAFVGSAIVGWLLGPFLGNAVFNMRYRALRSQIVRKEKEFYNRIKKFRVDPTSSSMQNPVPDYYGEKIGSVTDYRRWLKDQRAFNLKRGKML